MSEELQVVERQDIAPPLPRLNVAAIKARVADIEQVISDLMVRGVHYGPPYPNAEKDSLHQPGAELLLEAFYIAPHPVVREVDVDPPGNKRFIVTGHLEDHNGRNLGTFEAECSTLEPKYRYRLTGLSCPECGFEGALLKSKPRKGDPPAPPEGLGWFCWNKKGGCGANFPPGDERILEQKPGRSEHPDPAENYHTCKSMAEKRWLVAVTKRTFALSARFVDAEAARAALFDWKKAAPLLRAMPGDKKEKWNRVILECLQQFGKPPEQLTALEGSVIVQQLADQIQSPADLQAEDFMESPEAPAAPPKVQKAAKPPKPAEPEPAPESPADDPPMPASESAAFAKELRRLGALDEFMEVHKEPPDWKASTAEAARAAIRAATEKARKA